MRAKKKQGSYKQEDDQIDFDKHLFDFKKVIFKLFTFYNKKILLVPHLIIYLLNLIEFLQTLYFIINPDLQIYHKKSIVLNGFSHLISYLNIKLILEQNRGITNFSILVAIFCYMTINMMLAYYCYIKIASRSAPLQQSLKKGRSIKNGETFQQSKLKNVLTNLSVSCLLLTNTVLTVPIYSAIFPTFYCTSASRFKYSRQANECYDTVHILGIIISVFSFSLFAATKIACLTFLYERNPFRNNLFASESNISSFFKTALNILAIWYFILDPQLTYKPLYIASMIIAHGWYLFVFRWQKVGFYNKKYMKFNLTLEIVLFCFSINNLIQYFLPSGSPIGINFVEFLCTSFLLSYCTMCIIEHTKTKMVQEYYKNPQAAKKSPQADQFLIEMIDCMLNERNKQKKIINIKVLLKQLDKQPGSKLAEKQPQFLKLVNQYLIQKDKVSQKNYNLIVLNFLRILVDELIQIKSCFLFQGCRCALLFEYGIRTKAMCRIYKLQGEKLSWVDEFFLYQIKQRNRAILQQPEEEGLDSDQMDEQRIIEYDNYLQLIGSLQNKISQSVSLNKEFWNQILEQEPQFQYIKKLAVKLQENHKQIVAGHGNVQCIFQNSLKERFLYYSYLQTLDWSREHNQQMAEFLEYADEVLLDSPEKKNILTSMRESEYGISFQENEKIVMIELDFMSNEGLIKNCNSEVFGFLGYNRYELIGRKVEKIIPSIIAAKHSKFIQNFIEKKDSISKSSQRVIYGLHKDNYIVPGFLTIKVILNQERGLKLVSFIRPLIHQPRTFTLITSEEQSIIVGVSRQISQQIRDQEFISAIKSQTIYMEMLFPKLKVNQISANTKYKIQMVTFNGLQNQLLEQRNVFVQLRFQKRTYQCGVNLRYYFVKYIQRIDDGSVGTNPQFQSSDKMTQTVNTKRVIETFGQKRQAEKHDKIEQLCRYKKNYLNRFSMTKYYFFLVLFFLFFMSMFSMSLVLLLVGNQFQRNIAANNSKIHLMNMLSKDISMLTVKCQDFYQVKTEQQLNQVKNQYYQMISQYNYDFKSFTDFAEISENNSIFNLKVAGNKRQRIKAFYDFQTSSTQFLQMQLLSQMDQKNRINFKILRGIMLKLASQILRDDIDVELDKYIKSENVIKRAKDDKFWFSIFMVGFFLSFVVVVWACGLRIRIKVQKNLSILNLLSLNQVALVTRNLSQYLKLFLSTKVQDEGSNENLDKLTFISGLALNRNSNKFQVPKNKKLSMSSFDDENILNRELSQNGTNDPSKVDRPAGQQHLNQKLLIKKQHRKKINQSQSFGIEVISQFNPTKNPLKYQSGTSLSKVLFKDSFHDQINRGAKNAPSRPKRKSSFNVEMQISIQVLGNNSANRNINSSNQKGNNRNVNIGTQKLKMDRIKSQSQLIQVQNEGRRQRKRMSSMKNVYVKVEYPRRIHYFIFMVILVLIFGGFRYALLNSEQQAEQSLMSNQNSINKLVQVSNKMMYLRSFVSPYFSQLQSQSSQRVIDRETLSRQIYSLQECTTISFVQLSQTQIILKNIYRQISLYLSLVQTFPPKPQPPGPQLAEGIGRLQTNLLKYHGELQGQIQKIEAQSAVQIAGLRIKLLVQFIATLVSLALILLAMYYYLLWQVKVDQKATFQMIDLIPLKLVSSNRNIYKSLKKHSN